MLSPKKTKYRKYHRARFKRISTKGYLVSFGQYAIIATSSGYVSAKQIEAARIVINRKIKKIGKMWTRIFPDMPITKKPAEIRMGKGKGSVHEWAAVVNPGRILYEISGVNEISAKEIIKLAQAKLSVSTRFVSK
jgi:large subunit ribosomal protein L16